VRVSYMKPGRRAREERVVAGQFPDYDTDDRGEPSDASAEDVRTYAAHGFFVAAAVICSTSNQALAQVPQRWRRQRLLISTVRNR